ncbi:MAG TPA: hypothetical protein VL688_07540 [Verrucomicrobiae bacterium]|nr:hypothetical protein [Verrucomicrobiae bacterium]
MSFFFRHIQHLVRYFAILGILVFVAYWMQAAGGVSLALIGPIIYLAHILKSAISVHVSALPDSAQVNDFGFLLPLCVVYYTLIGFQIKQLWNESGIARTLTLVTLMGFLVFIHFFAWKNLTGYFLPNA